MTTSTSDESTQSIEIPEPAPASRAKKILRRTGWISFTLFCLGLFTILKLPDERITQYVVGQINVALAPKGISITPLRSSFSILMGPSIQMQEVTVNLPPPATPVKVDEIMLAPSLAQLILGRTGGHFRIQQGEGKLTGAFWTKDSKTASPFSVSVTPKSFHLDKTGLLTALAGIQGGALINGSVSLEGDLQNLSTLDAKVDLTLDKIELPEQRIAGFAVPRIAVSKGTVQLTSIKGKASIKTFEIGKLPSDDVRATVTGDAALGKQWDSTLLNLRVKLALSETILKAFPLLDAILGGAKLPDGSYAYKIAGPVSQPNAVPDK